jgi:hypothetical protein
MREVAAAKRIANDEIGDVLWGAGEGALTLGAAATAVRFAAVVFGVLRGGEVAHF